MVLEAGRQAVLLVWVCWAWGGGEEGRQGPSTGEDLDPADAAVLLSRGAARLRLHMHTLHIPLAAARVGLHPPTRGAAICSYGRL